MEKKRSVGVTVIGLLCIIYPFLVFTGFSVYVYLLNFFIYKLIFAILAIILFVGGIGILFLKPWARKLIIIFSQVIFILSLCYYGFLIICIIFGWDYYVGDLSLASIILFFKGLIVILFNFLIHIGFFILLLFFLTRPKVKEQFR